MKLEDIKSEWLKDVHIDETNLSQESLRIPIIHSKYLGWFTDETLLFKKMKHDYYKLLKLKRLYYRNKLSDLELKQLGWEPVELLIVREEDMESHLQGDNDLIDTLLKLALQEAKVDYLKEVIRSLNSRNFIIKEALAFLRWASGG